MKSFQEQVEERAGQVLEELANSEDYGPDFAQHEFSSPRFWEEIKREILDEKAAFVRRTNQF